MDRVKNAFSNIPVAVWISWVLGLFLLYEQNSIKMLGGESELRVPYVLMFMIFVILTGIAADIHMLRRDSQNETK